MALIIEPEAPLGSWFAALDEQIGRSAGFFADRPVIADLSSALEPGEGPETLLETLDALAARNFRIIGVDGVDPALLAGTRWDRLPSIVPGQEVRRAERAVSPPVAAAAPAPLAEPPPPAIAPSLLIDRPVRSGQSIFFEEGDVTVVGSVASGAEVIAGGSIHVYGALRGRAIAGVRKGAEARIFCRKLEAELVAVDELYRTAEHWGAGLHGCAVQIRRDRGSLKLTALV